MRTRCSEIGPRCNEKVWSMNSDACSGICVWLFKTGNTRYNECDYHCIEQARVSEPLTLRVLAIASGVLATARKLKLWTVSWVLVFTLCLAKTESTHCSKWGFHCKELARVGKPKLLGFFATVSLLFRCNKSVYCRNEKSLHCDNLTCNIIVKMLWRYDKVSLLSIDNINNLMIDVHDGTLAYAYICDVANKSPNCNMMPRYCVIRIMLLGCMIGDVSTIVEPETQCHDIALLRPTCWVERVYMHYIILLLYAPCY